MTVPERGKSRACPACKASASGLCSWHRDYGPDTAGPSRLVPGLIAGSERIHIEGLEDEIARLRHGLTLIVRESEQFSGHDGIGAGTMARNLLSGDLTRAPVGDGNNA